MIKFDVSGIDHLCKRIQHLLDTLPTKLKLIMQKLGDMGVDIAQASFRTAQYDGTNDVVCSTRWVNDKRLDIVANGEAVAFIEFGTGVHYVDDHPKRVEMRAVRGMYGYRLGRFQFWDYPAHKGRGTNGQPTLNKRGLRIVTQGNPPSYSLYNTAKELRTKVQEVAEEVLNND